LDIDLLDVDRLGLMPAAGKAQQNSKPSDNRDRRQWPPLHLAGDAAQRVVADADSAVAELHRFIAELRSLRADGPRTAAKPLGDIA